MIDEGSVRESFNMMIKSIVVMTTGELVNHHHGQVRHLPALVLPVKEVPYTVNGKKVVKYLNMVLIQFGTKLKKCWFKPFEELLTIRCLKGGGGNQEDTKRSGGKFLAPHPACKLVRKHFLQRASVSKEKVCQPTRLSSRAAILVFVPQVKNKGALANPACLDLFANIPETKVW